MTPDEVNRALDAITMRLLVARAKFRQVASAQDADAAFHKAYTRHLNSGADLEQCIEDEWQRLIRGATR